MAEREIQDAIKAVSKGKTTIIIAHRLSTVREVDRIIVLKDGALVEEGNFTELMKKRGEFFNLYSAQFWGIHNFKQQLSKELERAHLSGKPLTLLVLEIDWQDTLVLFTQGRKDLHRILLVQESRQLEPYTVFFSEAVRRRVGDHHVRHLSLPSYSWAKCTCWAKCSHTGLEAKSQDQH